MADDESLESRKPTGARPPPPKKKRSLFPRRQATKDASEVSPQISNDPATIGKSASQDDRSIRYDSRWISESALSEEPSNDVVAPSFDATVEGSGRRSPAPFNILSPRPMRVASPAIVSSDMASGENGATRAKATRALKLQTSRANLVSPPPQSPALTHWSNLRHAFMSNAAGRVASPSPAQAFSPPISKPAVARPSRFARFALRNIAEQGRGSDLNEARQFQEAIRTACWAARFGSLPIATRARWQGPDTIVSSIAPLSGFSTSNIHLPLHSAAASASNLSLPSMISSVDPTPSGLHSKRKGARATSPPTLNAKQSLQPLLHVLHHYRSIVRQPSAVTPTWLTRLPLEADVLSVMSIPFLTEPSMANSADQWMAVDCFELITKTWMVSDLEDGLERLIWCCQASAICLSEVRDRLLDLMRSILTTITNSSPASPPVVFRSFLHALVTLQAILSPQSGVTDIIANVTGGKWASADKEAFEEEYDHAKASERELSSLPKAMLAEAVTRTLGVEGWNCCSWIFSVLQDYWPVFSSGSLSDIQSRMYCRNTVTFNRAALTILRASRQSPGHIAHARQAVLDICMSRVLPYLRYRRWSEPDVCRTLASVLLEILVNCTEQERLQCWRMIEELWQADGTGADAVVADVKDMTTRGDWKSIISQFSALLQGHNNDVANAIMARIIPLLFERLAAQGPDADADMPALLTQLSQKYPQHFYKPLFSCAGSMKEDIIASQLCILSSVAHLTPDFWLSNAEMVAVAIFGDIGSGLGKGKLREGASLKWSKTRLGQCIVMFELLGQLQRMRNDRRDGPNTTDSLSFRARKFIVELENRIAILLDAKEQATLLPFSHRILLSLLLLSMRKLTWSLKPAPWLPRLLAWFREAYIGAQATRAVVPSDGQGEANVDDIASVVVTQAIWDEVTETFARIDAVCIASESAMKSSKASRTFSVASPMVVQGDFQMPKIDDDAHSQWSSIVAYRESTRKSLPLSIPGPFLSLLVAVNGLLQPEDYVSVGPIVWNHYLDSNDAAVVGPASFLFMQFGEKCPDIIPEVLARDLASHDPTVRHSTIRRISHLFSRRHEILSQYFITDRTHRRPFKGVRQPIAFVPTDMGSSQYVDHSESDDTAGDVVTGVGPEVKKRLIDIGWLEDDHTGSAEAALEKMHVSTLPSQLVHRLGQSSGNQPLQNLTQGPQSSPGSARPLLRRKSSGSSYYAGVKRRMIFVPSVAARLPGLGDIAFDDDPLVAGHTQVVLSAAMREDSALVARRIMEGLSVPSADVDGAMHALRLLLYSQSPAPPSFTHHVFNHLNGFLKSLSRDTVKLDAFQAFAVTLPLIAKLTPQVSEVAVRDLRRNKVEVFLLPSGFFWFPPTAPSASMFPRALPLFSDQADGTPLDLLRMFAVRTAQNMLTLQLLIRDPKEVYLVKKNLVPLFPPSPGSTTRSISLSGLSAVSHGAAQSGLEDDCSQATLSRSYLLVAVQIFKSLSSNLNDQSELTRLMDGVNSTVLAHLSDVGIVTHSLIAYVTASTRYRRLVASHNGFALFMPSVWELYRKTRSHTSIRTAIQHAIRCFYAVHDETFVFQCLDSLGAVLLQDGGDMQNHTGDILYDLLNALDSSSLPREDTAGLQGLFSDVWDNPGSPFIEKGAPFGRVFHKSTPSTSDGGSSKLMPKKQRKPFPLENLVRLCLTVIAHDVTAQRAERFLRILRILAPKLYQHSTSTRTVLREGIDALGGILSKGTGNRQTVAGTDATQARLTGSSSEKDVPSAAAVSGSLLVLRREYFLLLRAFTDVGGTPTSASIAKCLQLVRTILKESLQSEGSEMGQFLQNYSRACFAPQSNLNRRHSIAVLRDLSHLFRTYGTSMDFSGVLDVVEGLTQNPSFSSDQSFKEMIVGEWCATALAICEAAAAENSLWDLPLRGSTVRLLSSAVALDDMDVFSVIERRQQSGALIAGIILPLSLSLCSTSKSSEGSPQQTPEARCSQWLRLLSYILPVCEPVGSARSSHERRRLRKSSPTRQTEKSSNEAVQDPSRSRLAVSIFAFQVLKIILLRGIQDISRAPSHIWPLVASKLRDLLEDGNADFALSHVAREKGVDHSVPPSPTPSPRNLFLRPDPSDVGVTQEPDFVSKLPRTVDFLLWTMLEMVVSHSTPLLLYMRLFIQEKLHGVDTRAQEQPSPRSPARASVFVRSRANSLVPEPAPVPRPRSSFVRGSPGSTPTKLGGPSYFQLNPSPSASPIPSPMRSNHPHIVHLGPLARNGSQIESLLGSQTLSTPLLTESTKRSLQAVQTSMGYFPLDQAGMSDPQAWTRARALARVVEETEALIKVEFRDQFMPQGEIGPGIMPLGPVTPQKEAR